MLAHALLNELFNVFPILFYVKVCVGAMQSFQYPPKTAVRNDKFSLSMSVSHNAAKGSVDFQKRKIRMFTNA